MDDYYQVLGVSAHVSQDEIKQRFRFLALAYHPDKFATETQKAQAEEAFKKINEANGILSNPARRAQYDAQRSTSDPRHEEDQHRKEAARAAQRRAKAAQRRTAAERRRTEEERRKREEAVAARYRAQEEKRLREQMEAERRPPEAERRWREDTEALLREYRDEQHWVKEEQRRREQPEVEQRFTEEERRKREEPEAVLYRAQEFVVSPQAFKFVQFAQALNRAIRKWTSNWLPGDWVVLAGVLIISAIIIYEIIAVLIG